MAAALARFLSIPDDPVLGRSRAAKPVLHLQKDFFQLLVIDGLHHPAEGRLAGSRIAIGLWPDAQSAALGLAQAFGEFGQVLLPSGRAAPMG
jgi:hypothetical protein